MNGGCPPSMGGHCPPMNGMGPGGPMGPHHMNGHHPMHGGHLNGGGPPPPGMMSHGMGGHHPMGPPDGMMGRGGLGMPSHSMAPCTSSGGGNCSGPMTSYSLSGSHVTSTSTASSSSSPSLAPLPPMSAPPGPLPSMVS